MTVSSETSRNGYTGDGSTTEFVFRNKIFAGTDLKVYVDGTLQTITTNYTVTIDTDDNEATVTFVTAPSNGAAVVLLRDVPNTQGSAYPAGGTFPSTVTEDALDRRTIVSQQIEEKLGRTLSYLESDASIPSGTLPTLENLKGKVLGFSASTGAPVVLDPDTLGGGVADQTIANNWGSDYDLSFGAGTDQAEALQDVLDAAATTALTYGPQTVRIVSTGGALQIDARVTVPSNVTLDLSQTPLARGKYGEVAIQGSLTESPSANLIRLAQDAAAGASTVYLDTTSGNQLENSPSNASRVGANGTITYQIFRGKSDANLRAIQRWEGLVTVVDDADPSSIEVTLDPPLPDDEGIWEVEYPAGDYEEATGTTDRTLITIVASGALASNAAEDAQALVLSDASDFAAGDMCILFDNYLASEVAGLSENSIRTESVVIRRKSSNTVYLESPIGRDYTTARAGRLLKVSPIENAHVIGGQENGVTEAPDDPGSRIHYFKGSLCRNCTISNVQVDESGFTYAHRGQAARFERSYNCHIHSSYRFYLPATLAGSGDIYAFALYYCGGGSSIHHTADAYCRHGLLVQGSVDFALHDFKNFSPQINGFDVHGLDERRGQIYNFEVFGSEFGAVGNEQRAGGTIGNTFHAGGAKHISVRDGLIHGFVAGDNSSGVGIIIRPNVSKVQIADTVRIINCDRGVQCNVRDEWPTLGFSDIDIQANFDGCYVGVGVNGKVQDWSAGLAVTGATELDYAEADSGKLYSTDQTGTTGSTEPTGTGSAIDDDSIEWDYVSAVERVATDFRISGIIRNATRPLVLTRIDDLNVTELDIQAAQQVELTNCPGVLFRNITGAFDGSVWLESLSDNTTIYLDSVRVGGASLTNSDGATIEDSGISGLAAVATTGDYTDLSNKPAFGTAVLSDVDDFATGAEGDLAANALQPSDIASGAITAGTGTADLTGTNGQVWTVDGSGNISFEDAAPTLLLDDAAYSNLDAGSNVTIVDNMDGTATINVGSGTATLGDGTYSSIVVSGSGTNLDLVAEAVDNTMLAHMAADTIKGRANGAGTGDATDLTAAQVRTIINVADGATVDQTAQEIATAIDADATAESTLQSALGLGALAYLATVDTAQIDDDAITVAKLADLAAYSVILRASGTTGAPAAVQAAVNTVLGRGATGNLGFIAPEFTDGVFRVIDNDDTTKKLAFEVGSNVSTATTRTVTVPGQDGTLVVEEDLATLLLDYDGTPDATKALVGSSPPQWAALNPEQVSLAEKTAGTETALRSFSPKDVADMADMAGGGGGGSGGLSLVNDASTALVIGDAVDGTYRQMTSDSAIALTLDKDASIGAKVAVNKAGDGAITVSVEAGAGYIATTDPQDATPATASFGVIGYCEFECVANSDTVSAVWEVVGQTDLESGLTGDLNAADKVIRRPELKDFSETVNDLGNQSGAIAIDYEDGPYVKLVLTGNGTSTTISNWPASGKLGSLTVEIDHGSSPYSFTHPANTEWPDNTAPTLTDTANTKSVVTYVTDDAGSSIQGFFGGANRQ